LKLRGGMFPDDAIMRYNNIEIESKRYRKDAYMIKTATSSRFRREGFTLIELLIVIVVMAILATMLAPTISKIIQSADTRQSQAFVQGVARAADAFKRDNNGRYPGQDDIGQLAGTTPEAGPYTGSQIIAARLFGYPDTEIKSDAPKPIPPAGTSRTRRTF